MTMFATPARHAEIHAPVGAFARTVPLRRLARFQTPVTRAFHNSLSDSLSNARSLLPALEDAKRLAEEKQEPAVQAENRAFDFFEAPDPVFVSPRLRSLTRSVSPSSGRLACGARGGEHHSGSSGSIPGPPGGIMPAGACSSVCLSALHSRGRGPAAASAGHGHASYELEA